MSVHYNELSVANIMFDYKIGTVTRVDFTPINKQPGFSEEGDVVVKSAFVHFSDPILTSDNEYHYRSTTAFSNQAFWDAINYSNGSYTITFSEREYWICLKNKNPVRRTMMNLHQVVESGRHLENLIEEQSKKLEEQSKKLEEQSKKIEEQSTTIKAIEEKMEGMHEVLYQLLGGLYNQKTQAGSLNSQLDYLLPETCNTDDDNTENTNTRYRDHKKSWNIWPTTRQGDSNESRIEELERQVMALLNPTKTFASYDDETDSTHSSMPELVCGDDSDTDCTHSSMPDLVCGDATVMDDTDSDNSDTDSTYSSMPGLINTRELVNSCLIYDNNDW